MSCRKLILLSLDGQMLELLMKYSLWLFPSKPNLLQHYRRLSHSTLHCYVCAVGTSATFPIVSLAACFQAFPFELLGVADPLAIPQTIVAIILLHYLYPVVVVIIGCTLTTRTDTDEKYVLQKISFLFLATLNMQLVKFSI